MIPRSLCSLSLLWATLLALSATGCSSMTLRNEQTLAQAMHAMQPQQPAARAVIELRDGDRQPSFSEVQLKDGMTVQDALETSGITRKYSAITAELVRSARLGAPVRMPVRYDRGQRRVEPETDYLLHPGDRIVVEDRPLAGLQDMFGPVLEPLGPLFKRLDRSTGDYQFH